MQASGHPTTSSTAPRCARAGLDSGYLTAARSVFTTNPDPHLCRLASPLRSASPSRFRSRPAARSAECPYRPPGSLYSILSLGREP